MYDIVVVGAGPAGSFAAYASARKGLKTLLIEKERLPRRKPCGGVTGNSTVSRLGSGVYRVMEAKSDYNDILYNFRRLRSIKHRQFFFRRDKLDYFITKMAMDAGAEVIDSCPVECVVSGPDGVKTRTAHMEFKSRLLVGADGVHSTVGRSIGLVHNDRKKYAAVVGLVESPGFGGLLGDGRHNRTFFFDDLLGFAWMIPNKGSINIGMGALVGKAKGLRRKFEHFCGKLGLACPETEGHLIPYSLLRKFQKGRVLLVGDAAGFVNAWTGGGIGPGIYSAERAVETAVSMIENDDFTEEASRKYPAACMSRTRNLRLRTALVGVFDWIAPSDYELPSFAEPVVKRLSEVAPLSL